MKELIFLINTGLMYSTPLILAAMGGVLSENAGIINIALEGMMTIGAFIGSLIAIKTNNPWLGFFAGGLGGFLLSLLHSLASIKYKANQVVSGMAINFLGSGLSIFLCRLIFDGTSMTPPLELDKKLPIYFGQYASVYIAFILAIVVWFYFNKTIFGLRFLSVGEHPKATDAAGVNAKLYQFLGISLSGFLAGLGGASLSLAIVSNFRPTLISGQGFIAIAALIFGKWKPIPTMFACLFFGLSQALVVLLGGMETLKISSQILSILPYILTIIILIGFMGKTKAPSSLGAPL